MHDLMEQLNVEQRKMELIAGDFLYEFIRENDFFKDSDFKLINSNIHMTNEGSIMLSSIISFTRYHKDTGTISTENELTYFELVSGNKLSFISTLTVKFEN